MRLVTVSDVLFPESGRSMTGSQHLWQHRVPTLTSWRGCTPQCVLCDPQQRKRAVASSGHGRDLLCVNPTVFRMTALERTDNISWCSSRAGSAGCMPACPLSLQPCLKVTISISLSNDARGIVRLRTLAGRMFIIRLCEDVVVKYGKGERR